MIGTITLKIQDTAYLFSLHVHLTRTEVTSAPCHKLQCKFLLQLEECVRLAWTCGSMLHNPLVLLNHCAWTVCAWSVCA